MSKIDEYLHNERQDQFSDDKRAEVEKSRVGLSKLSENNVIDLERMKRIARAKNQSVTLCLLCDKPFLNRDTRQQLCPDCMKNKKQAFDLYKARFGNNTTSGLTPKIKERILADRTVLRGPFKTK